MSTAPTPLPPSIDMPRRRGLPGVLLGAVAGAARGAASALANVVPFRRRGAPPAPSTVTPEPALASRISHSARLMAGRRAVESEQVRPVFVDALAAALAGKEVVREVRGRPPFAPGFGPRAGDARLPVTFLGVRTTWFDHELADALAGLTGTVAASIQAADGGGGVTVSLTPHTTRPPTQVLALGAGMDGRPWRTVAPSVTWYEVDGADVAAGKRAALAAAEAQTGAADAAPAASFAHPLTVASHTIVEADLTKAGWAKAVLAAGWDVRAPSLVLAEGLLYYIGPSGVSALLTEAASITPPASAFLADAMASSGVAALRARGLATGGKGLEVAWCYGTPLDIDAAWATLGWRLECESDLAAAGRRLLLAGARDGGEPAWRLGFDATPAGVARSPTMVLLLRARRQA